MISVIIPVYNEEKLIARTLDILSANGDIEVIVVDGGSSDCTLGLLGRYPVKVITQEKGRAGQLNSGARAAQGDILLFLHADCYPEVKAFQAIERCIKRGFIGGCLRYKIEAPALVYRWIERSGDIRARLFKIFYGDQAIFVRKDVFTALGGFDDVDLFDDILFSKKMRCYGRISVLDTRVYASARRWQTQGVVKTSVVNWLISAGFLLGVSPALLKKIYPDIR